MKDLLKIIAGVRKMMSMAICVLMALASGAGGIPYCVDGIYPHLAMFNGEGECGTGAVVPWAGSLCVGYETTDLTFTDGIVEAVEGVDYPAFAVQFHPEMRSSRERESQAIFNHLMELVDPRF